MYKISAGLRGLGRGRGHIERIRSGDFDGALCQNTVVQFTHTLSGVPMGSSEACVIAAAPWSRLTYAGGGTWHADYGVGVVRTAVTVDGAGAVLARLS